MSNLPSNVTTSAPSLDLSSKEVLNTIRTTVAHGATDAEFAMFIEFCKSTRLNPFKKEIWFIKARDRVQMMTGINGFYTIANNHPAYDGMEEVTFETDEKGKLISATAKAWRKDRRFPSIGTAYMSEYAGTSPIWQQKPRMMLAKVAESIALRKAFPQELNGLYTQEEMPAEYSGAPAPRRTQTPVSIDVTPPEARPAPKRGLSLEEDDLPAKFGQESMSLVRVNELIAAEDWDELGLYKIQSEKALYLGKTLYAVAQENPAWFHLALSKYRDKLHITDQVAIEAYAKAYEQLTSAATTGTTAGVTENPTA